MSGFKGGDHCSCCAGSTSTPSSCTTTAFGSTTCSDISNSTESLSSGANVLFVPYHESLVASSPYPTLSCSNSWADQLPSACNVYQTGQYGVGIGSWADSFNGVLSTLNDSTYAMPLLDFSMAPQVQNEGKDYHDLFAGSTGMGTNPFPDSLTTVQQRLFSYEPSALLGSMSQPKPLMKHFEQHTKPTLLPGKMENFLYAGHAPSQPFTVGQNLDETTGLCENHHALSSMIVPSYPALPELPTAPELGRMSLGFVLDADEDVGGNAFPHTPSSLAFKHLRPLSQSLANRDEVVPSSSCDKIKPSRPPAEVPLSHYSNASKNKTKDELLLEYKAAGMSYKEIKVKGRFEEAESTLRGRFRTLTKTKAERVRKPEWTERDVWILKETVAQHLPEVSGYHSSRHGARAQQHAMNKVPWKQVAEIMANRGCYHYGNATVKKKYLEVSGWD